MSYLGDIRLNKITPQHLHYIKIEFNKESTCERRNSHRQHIILEKLTSSKYLKEIAKTSMNIPNTKKSPSVINII